MHQCDHERTSFESPKKSGLVFLPSAYFLSVAFCLSEIPRPPEQYGGSVIIASTELSGKLRSTSIQSAFTIVFMYSAEILSPIFSPFTIPVSFFRRPAWFLHQVDDAITLCTPASPADTIDLRSCADAVVVELAAVVVAHHHCHICAPSFLHTKEPQHLRLFASSCGFRRISRTYESGTLAREVPAIIIAPSRAPCCYDL